jgi:hypothetical protein
MLKRTRSELVISKRKLREVEGIELVWSNREQGTQNLCFSSRPIRTLRSALATSAEGSTPSMSVETASSSFRSPVTQTLAFHSAKIGLSHFSRLP